MVESWQGPLWEAIDRVVAACTGTKGQRIQGVIRREKEVVVINDLVREVARQAAVDECDRLAKVFEDAADKAERDAVRCREHNDTDGAVIALRDSQRCRNNAGIIRFYGRK